MIRLFSQRLWLEGTHVWSKITGRRRRAQAAAKHAYNEAVANLGPGDIAIDLGANVGEFTAPLADTGARVFAFEPDPLAFAMLHELLGHRDNVTLFNAAAGIETAGRHNGIGRADGHAGTAFAAGVFDLDFINRQWRVGENLTQKKPRACLFVEQQGVLAYPAKPGISCQGFFQNRRAVYKGAITERANKIFDFRCQCLQTITNNLVIVTTDCITGNKAEIGV